MGPQDENGNSKVSAKGHQRRVLLHNIQQQNEISQPEKNWSLCVTWCFSMGAELCHICALHIPGFRFGHLLHLLYFFQEVKCVLIFQGNKNLERRHISQIWNMSQEHKFCDICRKTTKKSLVLRNTYCCFAATQQAIKVMPQQYLSNLCAGCCNLLLSA